MKIGYIGMAAKPYTKGHHLLIKEALKECDLVKVFVSTKDRLRDGEYKIKGSTMNKIWERFILDVLPEQVDVFFVEAPIKELYKVIGQEDKGQDKKIIHIIYGDETDIQKNFPFKSLNKYFPTLVSSFRIETKPFVREEVSNISSTMMRKFLELELCNDFIDGLPEEIRKHGNDIWTMLKEEN